MKSGKEVIFEEIPISDFAEMMKSEDPSNKVYVFSDINDTTCKEMVKTIHYLNTVDSIKHIELYINCNGGDLWSGLAMANIIKGSKKPVHTYGVGMVGSAAIALMASGKKGKRFYYKNAMTVVHQPYFQYTENVDLTQSGKNTEILDIMLELYSDACTVNSTASQRKKFEKLVRSLDEQYCLLSVLKQYGIIDKEIS